jgi:DNA processing protein
MERRAPPTPFVRAQYRPSEPTELSSRNRLVPWVRCVETVGDARAVLPSVPTRGSRSDQRGTVPYLATPPKNVTGPRKRDKMETDRTREHAAVLSATRHSTGPWWNISQLLDEAGSALALLEQGKETVEAVELLEVSLPATARAEAVADLEEFEELIRATRDAGDKLLTVLDDAYPTSLRLVYDRPPFLFVRGTLPSSEVRALAVVGTRSASPEGLEQAGRLAGALATHGVVVVSGLARGIDSAAHEATLAAGGTTVAVMGTGIRRVYPEVNQSLAHRIVESGGALVSQFFPDSPPRSFNFPLRNRTMSGLAAGTAVVEASHTSGARMQARVALEHGKRVFLVSGLVTREKWATSLLGRPGVAEVKSVDAILGYVDRLDELVRRPAEQLVIA